MLSVACLGVFALFPRFFHEGDRFPCVTLLMHFKVYAHHTICRFTLFSPSGSRGRIGFWYSRQGMIRVSCYTWYSTKSLHVVSRTSY